MLNLICLRQPQGYPDSYYTASAERESKAETDTPKENKIDATAEESRVIRKRLERARRGGLGKEESAPRTAPR